LLALALSARLQHYRLHAKDRLDPPIASFSPRDLVPLSEAVRG
jgi:hypothetical protein